MAKIGVDTSELKTYLGKLKKFNNEFKDINRELNKILPKELLTILKQETPRDTGVTSDSWNIKTSSTGFTISNKNGHIIEFLMKGTNPHVIKPKDSSVLSIKLPGSILFVKYVNHPGYSPQIDEDSFYEKILKKTSDIVDKIVNEKMKKLLS